MPNMDLTSEKTRSEAAELGARAKMMRPRRLGPRRELGVVRTPPRQQRLGVDVGVRAIEADVNEPSIGPERRKILESGRHAIFRRPPPKSHKKSRESHARPNFQKTFAKVWD